jgi:hypothetical protein
MFTVKYTSISRRRTVLEMIRTFWGKVRGLRGERQTIVEQGTMWRCTQCLLIFPTKKAGDDHKCQDQKLS